MTMLQSRVAETTIIEMATGRVAVLTSRPRERRRGHGTGHLRLRERLLRRPHHLGRRSQHACTCRRGAVGSGEAEQGLPIA